MKKNKRNGCFYSSNKTAPFWPLGSARDPTHSRGSVCFRSMGYLQPRSSAFMLVFNLILSPFRWHLLIWPRSFCVYFNSVLNEMTGQKLGIFSQSVPCSCSAFYCGPWEPFSIYLHFRPHVLFLNSVQSICLFILVILLIMLINLILSWLLLCVLLLLYVIYINLF